MCDAVLLQLRRKAWRALPSFLVLDALVLVDDFPEVRAGDELRLANRRNADASPVAGLRPVRGALSTARKLPKPMRVTESPIVTADMISSKTLTTTRSASALEMLLRAGNAVNEVETIHLNTPGGSARPRQLKGMWLRGRRIFLGVALKNQGSA